MGLTFLIFGLNGVLQFLPMPPMQGDSADFVGLLLKSKLLFVVKALEVSCSLLLLSGLFVPVALLVLAPIIFNIFWFHITLAPEGAPFGIALVLMETFLLWTQKAKFAPLLKMK